VLDNSAEALLQGSATAGAAGNTTIQAQSQVQADTVSDGFIAEDASGGGASVAVSVVNNNTKAGVYQNASLLYSESFDILAYTLNNLDTSALQQEIIDLFDEAAAGTGEVEEGSTGAGVQVAGAFAFNKLNNTTEAAVNSTGQVNCSGLVNIETKALTNDSVLASGMSSSGTSGVGAAIAILSGKNSNQAYVGESSRIKAGALNILAFTEDFTAEDPLLADTVNDFTVKAYAGQVS
jgi:hypothetical protein